MTPMKSNISWHNLILTCKRFWSRFTGGTNMKIDCETITWKRSVSRWKVCGKKGRECCEVYSKILTFLRRRCLREFATLLRNVTLATRKPFNNGKKYDGKSCSEFDFAPSDILRFTLERIWRRNDLHMDFCKTNTWKRCVLWGKVCGKNGRECCEVYPKILTIHGRRFFAWVCNVVDSKTVEFTGKSMMAKVAHVRNDFRPQWFSSFHFRAHLKT